jgi:HEAT repeat protein
LIAWGQQQQRAGAISDEATGEEMLVFALESRQPQIRYLALLTMAQLGLVGQISHIYKRLYDPNEAIRDTAYRTLVQFQERLGTALPLPI